MLHVRTAITVLLVLLVTPALRADVLIVGEPAHFGTLSEAIASAADGDTIVIRLGVYQEGPPVVIDGKVFGTVTANDRGRAELERYVRLP